MLLVRFLSFYVQQEAKEHSPLWRSPSQPFTRGSLPPHPGGECKDPGDLTIGLLSTFSVLLVRFSLFVQDGQEL